MNKFKLLAAAALIVTATNAQVKRSDMSPAPPRPTLQSIKPEAKMQEMQMRTPGAPVVKAPERSDNINVWYRRPAGAFTSSMIIEDNAYAGFIYSPYLTVKPYSDYTFLGFAEGVSDNARYYWDVQYWDFDTDEQVWNTVEGKNLTWHWGYESVEVPTFRVEDNDASYYWHLCGYERTSSHPVIYEEHKAYLLSVPGSIEELWGYDLLKSSKTFTGRGVNTEGVAYPMTFYSGAIPYGQNEKGYWFGKNGGFPSVLGPTYHIDGIAQAFEKPEHPYLLKQVVMDCGILDVVGDVDMYCKIYKIDEIPAYADDDYVTLPDEPGELIAKGRAHLTPTTYEETSGLVSFSLFGEEDGLEIDITPSIDCAILVTIEGYNFPEMEYLSDFTAMIASNYYDDEGFGELAYLKVGVPDEEGNVDHYEWRGLNNFFSSGTMKTGLSIFLTTELPYLVFNYTDEDGEYTFPNEGGVMEKQFGDHTCRSIEFWSWVPSEDSGWEMTCKGDEIPDWLTIELEDQIKEGEFSGIVNAVVTAEPLPAHINCREATVRFEFPGAYIDYKFMQGTGIFPPLPPGFDYNKDGEINLADINCLIDLILTGHYDLGIPELNALIDYLLSNGE